MTWLTRRLTRRLTDAAVWWLERVGVDLGTVAARMGRYAVTAWTAQDVLQEYPRLTQDQALSALLRHERALTDELVEHGWAVLEELLGRDEELCTLGHLEAAALT